MITPAGLRYNDVNKFSMSNKGHKEGQSSAGDYETNSQAAKDDIIKVIMEWFS